MQKTTIAALAALLIAASSCGGYKAHEATIDAHVADALQLAEADRVCMQTDTCTWQIASAGITVYGSKAYDEGIRGFAGPTHVYIAVGHDGRIIGVIADDNAESPEFFGKLKDAHFFDNWNGLTLAEAASKEVDAVTGATYSSRGIADAVKATAQAVKE